MTEQWLDVAGWEGLYQVSSCGHVRSLDRTIETKNGWSYVKKGKQLQLQTNKAREIVCVHLQAGPKKWMSANVAWIVLEAFVGPKPEGLVVRHGSKGRLCNELSNLSYGTQSQNMFDRWRDGTMPHGSAHRNSKLSPETVREIRKLRDEGVTCIEVGKRFGVCKDVVSRIHRRTQWAWVD